MFIGRRKSVKVGFDRQLRSSIADERGDIYVINLSSIIRYIATVCMPCIVTIRGGRQCVFLRISYNTRFRNFHDIFKQQVRNC